MMFPYRSSYQPRPPAVVKDPKGGGRLVTMHGFSVEDRVKMVFAAATISTIEDETKHAAAAIAAGCGNARGDLGCLARGIADALWSNAVYDGDEGRRIAGQSEFDVYRTFRRVLTTGRFDCDCATASTVALAHLAGHSAVARVIEQKVPPLGGWSWTHIFPVLIAIAKPGLPPFPGLSLAGLSQLPLELTPVPPHGGKASIGWQTPASTYRRHLDFVYEPDRWRIWLSACDLDHGVLAPLPGVRQVAGVQT
jgi:hypothetical protein